MGERGQKCHFLGDVLNGCSLGTCRPRIHLHSVYSEYLKLCDSEVHRYKLAYRSTKERPEPCNEPILKLSLFGWADVGDWRMLTGAWSLKPFQILSSVTLSVTLTKDEYFTAHINQLTRIVATINLAS